MCAMSGYPESGKLGPCSWWQQCFSSGSGAPRVCTTRLQQGSSLAAWAGPSHQDADALAAECRSAVAPSRSQLALWIQDGAKSSLQIAGAFSSWTAGWLVKSPTF